MATLLDVSKLIALLTQQSPEQTHLALANVAQQIQLHLPPVSVTAIPAAVLIPIILHPTHPTILLTQRTSHLQHHPGQISFPGGKIDNTDTDAKACALREVKEEIGIDAAQIEIICDLGVWPSFSGYLITPFVGLIQPPISTIPCEHEVEEIFEIELKDAFDLTQYHRVDKDTPIPHHYYEMNYQNKRIWGFTASMLFLLATYTSFATPKGT